jgi:hypothetical protein
MPSSKRLFLALGFLDGVKARLDPSPFLCPLGLWLWLGVFAGIKRAKDVRCFVWLHQADFPLKKLIFSGDEKKLHDLLQSAEFDTSLFAGY